MYLRWHSVRRQPIVTIYVPFTRRRTVFTKKTSNIFGESLDVGHEAQRGRHTEVGAEQQLLETLEVARLHAPRQQDGDVRERDILDALPERAPGEVAPLRYETHDAGKLAA